jgi:hypothetical protein
MNYGNCDAVLFLTCFFQNPKEYFTPSAGLAEERSDMTLFAKQSERRDAMLAWHYCPATTSDNLVVRIRS